MTTVCLFIADWRTAAGPNAIAAALGPGWVCSPLAERAVLAALRPTHGLRCALENADTVICALGGPGPGFATLTSPEAGPDGGSAFTVLTTEATMPTQAEIASSRRLWRWVDAHRGDVAGFAAYGLGWRGGPAATLSAKALLRAVLSSAARARRKSARGAGEAIAFESAGSAMALAGALPVAPTWRSTAPAPRASAQRAAPRAPAQRAVRASPPDPARDPQALLDEMIAVRTRIMGLL